MLLGWAALGARVLLQLGLDCGFGGGGGGAGGGSSGSGEGCAEEGGVCQPHSSGTGCLFEQAGTVVKS